MSSLDGNGFGIKSSEARYLGTGVELSRSCTIVHVRVLGLDPQFCTQLQFPPNVTPGRPWWWLTELDSCHYTESCSPDFDIPPLQPLLVFKERISGWGVSPLSLFFLCLYLPLSNKYILQNGNKNRSLLPAELRIATAGDSWSQSSIALEELHNQ